MSRRYRYVGPEKIRASALVQSRGTPIHIPSDVQHWAQRTGQTFDAAGFVVATFVIDPQEQLFIADRHSEHVACAGGGDVLSAGEIFFAIHGTEICIDQITNQSTGYCPEPQSWDAVEQVLDRIGLQHPRRFTLTCTFRRCTDCGAINIVKDEWFWCDICGLALEPKWNFD